MGQWVRMHCCQREALLEDFDEGLRDAPEERKTELGWVPDPEGLNRAVACWSSFRTCGRRSGAKCRQENAAVVRKSWARGRTIAT